MGVGEGQSGALTEPLPQGLVLSFQPPTTSGVHVTRARCDTPGVRVLRVSRPLGLARVYLHASMFFVPCL